MLLCLSGIVDKTQFNTHSLCIGAKPSAKAANISDTHIQILGHWKSDAYKLYIHPLTNWQTYQEFWLLTLTNCTQLIKYSPNCFSVSFNLIVTAFLIVLCIYVHLSLNSSLYIMLYNYLSIITPVHHTCDNIHICMSTVVIGLYYVIFYHQSIDHYLCQLTSSIVFIAVFMMLYLSMCRRFVFRHGLV